MEGEKEMAEEKEEEEEDEKHLPIMHWEDLSQRIAELEQQEKERREMSKRGAGLTRVECPGGVWGGVWEEEEEEDFRKCQVAVVTSRFHNHKNLQLCFINNSDSEDEDQGTNRKVSVGPAGLKQEVVSALRMLRDKLLAEQKENEHLEGSSNSVVAKRKHLEHWELLELSEQQLNSIRASLQQDVHALSSDLVAQLLVRDQLTTKQDAMLLDVQDLT